MASKKHRRGIRGFYNRQARVDTVIAVLESKRQEADSKNQLWFESLEILKNLKDF